MSMKIEYVGHACLFIDTGDVKLTTDPWFQGSSYCGQWHIFPRPVNAGVLANSEAILISHGHEDHFHEPSLRALPKNAKVLYPYSWYGGAKPFLEQLGFSEVLEAMPEKCYRLTPNTTITYVANNLDSIIVIESGKKVVVNINDALHSYPTKIIDVFIRALKRRWPHIDTVLSGFGGASYFPNTIHCAGKNDVEIAETREQLFAHNFCRIVHELKPKVAVPFAADFALLNDNQRWINEVRFPRERLAEYYQELYGKDEEVRIEPLYSGDVLIDEKVFRSSPYRDQLRELGVARLIDRQYGQEIAARRTVHPISDADAESLRLNILENISSRCRLFASDALEQAKFAVKVLDVPVDNYFNIKFDSQRASVKRAAKPSEDAVLVIETSSEILLHSFGSEWGGDAITIGYGCEIHIFDSQTVKDGVDITCVRLLTRHPQASRHWKVEPIRVARQLLSSQTTRNWVVRAALNRASEYSETRNNDVMREWLFRSKCEVCRACDLPLLNEAFAAKL
jgi:hypothetical protein